MHARNRDVGSRKAGSNQQGSCGLPANRGTMIQPMPATMCVAECFTKGICQRVRDKMDLVRLVKRRKIPKRSSNQAIKQSTHLAGFDGWRGKRIFSQSSRLKFDRSWLVVSMH